MESLDSLIEFCKANGRVCPQPQRLNELYKLLPNTRQVGAGWVPSLPLILGGWWHSSDREKQERLEAHLRWAAEHEALEPVARLLHQLPATEWHHEGE